MVFETFSQRLRRAERGDEPDVYTYDKMPRFMRQQIAAAIREGIGVYDSSIYAEFEANDLWNLVARVCSKEVETFLNYRTNLKPDLRIEELLVNTEEVLTFLDVVEICCRVIAVGATEETISIRGAHMTSSETIDEINVRFQQHSVGYQIEDGFVIRVDSKFAHREIIKPALKLLRQDRYRKASADFLTAHQHYRAGDYKDAVTAANRAFESTLKAICDSEDWIYQSGDNAAQLVSLVSTSGLFTHAFDKSFGSFVAMMKTGLPALRNDAGAHGEGIDAAAVTAEIARYAINMTAANILFLAECHEGLRRRK